MTWAPDRDRGPAPRTVPERHAAVPAARRLPAGGRADPPAGTTLEVLRALGSGPRGLQESEVAERLVRYGENVVPGRRPSSWLRRVVRSVRDPFTAVLFCLAMASAAVAAWTTAGVITALVVVSCVLRGSGEYRADRASAALRELVAATVTVRRRADADAAPLFREVPVDQVVPGDVVALAPGDLVPADLRLLSATGLTVHQAALTGESAPVPKFPVDAPGSAVPAADEPQLCFQGSSVASGSGTAVVLATGARTRFAATFRGVAARRPRSAFDRSVRGISWSLIRFMLLTPPLVLLANAGLRGRGLETVPFAVAVAVGLTPEMLPVIVTTVLARGASQLARSGGVIVKRLPALHDLGAADVLCTDKTGTLTLDRPVVESSTGPDGAADPEVLRWAARNSLWTLQLADVPSPDALDEAILAAEPDDDGTDCDGVAAVPFDPLRRLSTAVLRTAGAPGADVLVVKGSAEAVLERCAAVRQDGQDVALDDGERARLLRACAEQAESGLRVLAVALAERPARPGSYDYGARDEHGLVFLGTVALRDAAAGTAPGALSALARHGVAVKVLTGDHPGTAARACRDIGLDPGTVITGADLDALSEEELAGVAGRTTVFARCSPEHKARVVGALRSAGHVTGFLGDGVNDLPALHAADVGICPRDAVDVAREAADVVLASKDLTAIAQALAAGRRSSANIATYLRVALSSNLGNVLAMLAAGLLVPFLPMLPAQVLLQNLCFDTAQLAFAHDRPGEAEVRRPAVLRPHALLRFVAGFGLLNAAADIATFAVLAASVRGIGASEHQDAFHAGWFTENLLTQALVMVLLRTGRGAAGSRLPAPILWSTAALAVVGLLLPLSPAASLLGFTALPLFFYALLAVVLTAYGTALQAAQTRYESRAAQVASGS